MPNFRALAIPTIAFSVGCGMTATLTTAAQAQNGFDASKFRMPLKSLPDKRPLYRLVITEADDNRYAAQGYIVREATGAGNYVQYLMQRTR